MSWIWVLIPLTALSIPIIAIISSVIEKYIKAQERQANLVSEELIAELAALKESQEEQKINYEKRIANLEAIVSAQASRNQDTRALANNETRYPMPDLSSFQKLKDDEKVALLAKELKD